ncbi:MAG: AAA family ATPase, partial [Novosphingobium sp.]|nr:AAA family ATPase [Novosphingobium sp.]
MADAATDTRPEARTVRLQVAGARQEESGHGIARISRHVMSQLGVTEGDVIEIVGKRSTAARVIQPYPEDEGLELIRLDGLQRANADVGSGEHVEVRKIDSRPAQRVVFAPAQKELRLQGP